MKQDMTLSEGEQDVVRRCLVAILDGPFIDDWEFQTRLGVDRQKLRAVLSEWPLQAVNDDELTRVAINNCINEIVTGITISGDERDKWFSVPRDTVKSTYNKWCKITSQNPGIK